MTIEENKALKAFNTFGIPATGRYFVRIRSESDFLELVKHPLYANQKKLIIGGGSNILLTGDFDGLVIKNEIPGIEVVRESAYEVLLRAGAGENWHQFVIHCIRHNLAGVENLSLIPGCVGASPMQNIGAYGVEIKEVFHELEALDMESGKKRVFTRDECGFGYRESVFKNKYRDRYFIVSVTFRLQKEARLNTSYGAIHSELEAMGVKNPNINDVARAVVNIRRSKLPDPEKTGNAGSFFKNPEVGEEQFAQLKSKHPDLVGYPLGNGKFKLAAGWLIERCGLKGYRHKGAAVHDRQALVLVNAGHCTGSDVLELSEIVMEKVRTAFGVELEREVNVV